MKEVRKPENPEKTPDHELQKKCHILNPENSSHKQDSNPDSSCGRRLGLFVVVCWLLNVPATCGCISGTDLLRQFDVLPH